MAHTALVDPETLAAHLSDPAWVIVDCRHELSDPEAGRSAYRAGHLPGAHFLHLDEALSGEKSGRNGRHPLPRPHTLAARLGELGIGERTQVVAYDAHGGMFAARLWWLLKWLGHEQVAVLDGGLDRWVAQGRPLSVESPATRPARFEPRVRPVDIAGDEVLSLLDTPRMCLIDARAPDRFRGENETLDPVGGHIPGARNRFFKHNLTADGRFKSPEALRSEWRTLLGDADAETTVHQCGSGVTACHNLLAMEVAGLPGGRLYAGSWSEWCANPSRPIARGDEAAFEAL